MNLEEIARTLESGADVQNVTAVVVSFIVELGRRASARSAAATVGPSNIISSDNGSSSGSSSGAINHEVDDTEILAHNITSILMRYYENNTALWEAIAINLEREEVLWKERANRRLSDLTSNIFITLYLLVIAIGSFGNFLVISAGIRQPTLRTPRNAFILNLAVSDLLLCLVTMPLTFIELTNDHWQFGDSMLSCKMAGGLQAVSVFVSTISITVIALDRYQLIVYPTKDLLKRIGAAAALFFIWLLGFLLASPIFVVRTLEHHDLNSARRDERNRGELSPGGVHSIDYCYEKWPVSHGRAIYSAFTLVIQYVLPILIISVLHSKIFQRLRARHTTLESIAVQDSLKRIRETKRLRRRHHLLMSIALIFSITWLPLNVLNLVLDVYNPFRHPDDEEKMLVIYAVCHLFGMSSACANPFLYGWFNDNFRNEFKWILSAPFRLCFGRCPPASSAQMFHDAVGASSTIRSVTTTSPENRTGHQHNKTEQQSIDMAERSSTVICAIGQPVLEDVFNCNNSSDEEMGELFVKNPLQRSSESDANDARLITTTYNTPFLKSKPLETHL